MLHISIVFISASSLCSPAKVLIYVVKRRKGVKRDRERGKNAAVAFNVPRRDKGVGCKGSVVC